MEEKIVFGITEGLIEAEANQEIDRELTDKEMEEIVFEIQSEADPIFVFIRECILKVTSEKPTSFHEGKLI